MVFMTATSGPAFHGAPAVPRKLGLLRVNDLVEDAGLDAAEFTPSSLHPAAHDQILTD